jgi:hypothetical protein
VLRVAIVMFNCLPVAIDVGVESIEKSELEQWRWCCFQE